MRAKNPLAEQKESELDSSSVEARELLQYPKQQLDRTAVDLRRAWGADEVYEVLLRLL